MQTSSQIPVMKKENRSGHAVALNRVHECPHGAVRIRAGAAGAAKLGCNQGIAGVA
jgi:hypothetical protein